jgi:hypothetical protein
MKTLYCDIVNGLMESGDDSEVTQQYEDEESFVYAVKHLKETEYICCDNISNETFKKLSDEYGIH